MRERAGVFDVSHMGEIETCGPQAAEFLQHLLSNDVRRIPEGGAQYALACLEDGGIVDDLFTYRLAERHFLTVTNAANHAKDLAWFQRQAEGFDVDVIDRADDFAMLAVQGPTARGIVGELADGHLPGALPLLLARRRRRPAAGRRHGLHGRGRRRAAGPRPRRRRRRCGTRCSRPGVEPVGLGARDTLRLEVNYHLYGNDMDETRNPIEAGLGWACKEDTGFVGADAVRRRPRGRAPPQKLVAFVHDRPRHRPPGQRRSPAAGVVTSGTMSPSLGVGHRHGLRARRRAPPPGTAARDRRAREDPHAPKSDPSRSTRRRPDPVADYPDDLKYHPEHDWARIDGDTATLGITWYAQDSLGEIVFFDPPQVGATITKDQPYAEVESVKAVSDVIAPLSGEITEVNEALSARPEKVNEDPYGDGWLVRIRLSDPSEVEQLLDAAAYEATLEG